MTTYLAIAGALCPVLAALVALSLRQVRRLRGRLRELRAVEVQAEYLPRSRRELLALLRARRQEAAAVVARATAGDPGRVTPRG